MDWQTLRNQFIRKIGGDLPGAQLEQELIDAYTEHPDAVERSIEKIAAGHAAGKIRSPWGALKTEVARAVNPANNPTHDKGSSKTKAVQRAEQWLRTAGLHYGRETEIIDELFGHRGMLREHHTPDLESRITDLWHELRPTGQHLEHDQETRLEQAVDWHRQQQAEAKPAETPNNASTGNANSP